jgi:hypothetical protein
MREKGREAGGRRDKGKDEGGEREEDRVTKNNTKKVCGHSSLVRGLQFPIVTRNSGNERIGNFFTFFFGD